MHAGAETRQTLERVGAICTSATRGDLKVLLLARCDQAEARQPGDPRAQPDLVPRNDFYECFLRVVMYSAHACENLRTARCQEGDGRGQRRETGRTR